MDNILGIPIIPPSSPVQQRYIEGIDMSRSGWLGFFQYRICITVIGCVLLVANFFSDVRADHQIQGYLQRGFAGLTPEEYALYIGVLFVCAILALLYHATFGIAVFYKIRTKKSNAPIWAMWYLLIEGIVACVLLGLCGGTIEFFWLEALHSVLWLLYFQKSVRVRLTFGRNILRRNAAVVA